MKFLALGGITERMTISTNADTLEFAFQSPGSYLTSRGGESNAFIYRWHALHRCQHEDAGH
jgi:hypothetical protein